MVRPPPSVSTSLGSIGASASRTSRVYVGYDRTRSSTRAADGVAGRVTAGGGVRLRARRLGSAHGGGPAARARQLRPGGRDDRYGDGARRSRDGGPDDGLLTPRRDGPRLTNLGRHHPYPGADERGERPREEIARHAPRALAHANRRGQRHRASVDGDPPRVPRHLDHAVAADQAHPVAAGPAPGARAREASDVGQEIVGRARLRLADEASETHAGRRADLDGHGSGGRARREGQQQPQHPERGEPPAHRRALILAAGPEEPKISPWGCPHPVTERAAAGRAAVECRVMPVAWLELVGLTLAEGQDDPAEYLGEASAGLEVDGARPTKRTPRWEESEGWWRRWELNPRPKTVSPSPLHP